MVATKTDPARGRGSRHSLHEVLERLHEVDASIYAIGLGPKVDRQVLEDLAGRFGGEAFFRRPSTRSLTSTAASSSAFANDTSRVICRRIQSETATGAALRSPARIRPS
jgi:hypothetical protein